MPALVHLVVVALLFQFAAPLLAQAGYSSAAMGRVRYLGHRGELPSPDEVRIDEILNYHRHQLPLPRAGEPVALDLRWDRATLGDGGTAVLQIGITTPRIRDRADLPPLNLAIVVDRSGSMRAADKLDRVQKALRALLTELRTTDRIAIVTYNHEVTVPLPSCEVGDGAAARAVIDGLWAVGRTALHGGLIRGFEEVRAHWREDATNRVILLTDGIANVGVTSSEEIADDARVWIDRGVDVSTIGVGRDLQRQLLRELATAGHGLYHFVESADEIDKVFDREVQSLLAPVGRDVRLELRVPEGVTVQRVIGCDVERRGDGAWVAKLPDLHYGLTQVALVEARVTRPRVECTAGLRFFPEEGGTARVVETRLSVPSSSGGTARDAEVARNHAIGLMAAALRDAAIQADEDRDGQALATLHDAIARAYAVHPHMEDEDLDRVRRIVNDWIEVLEARGADRRREI